MLFGDRLDVPPCPPEVAPLRLLGDPVGERTYLRGRGRATGLPTKEDSAVPDTPVMPLRTGPVLELLPPFPIVLVTTQTNVLTIGQIEYFTFSPLRIGIGVARSRHSHGLLVNEGEFVVNVPDASLVEAVRLCGRISGRDHDKFEAAGLQPEPSIKVQAVSIAQCRAKIECRIERQIDFEDRTWFIAQVAAARKGEGFRGRDGLLCDRHGYLLAGREVASR